VGEGQRVVDAGGQPRALAVDPIFDRAYAPITGEGDAADLDGPAGVAGVVAPFWQVDSGGGLDGGYIGPAAVLPVTLIVGIDDPDLAQPFDVFPSVDVWNVGSHGEAVADGQGHAVHGVGEHYFGLMALVKGMESE
jgi:hypothetical protein